MVDLNRTILAIRAVGTEFARRIYVPVLILVGVVLTFLTIVSIYLTTLSPWWWILAIVVMAWDLLIAIVFAIVGFIIRALDPQQTKPQKKAIKLFVDKLQSLSDITQTPKFILLFRIARDILSKRQGGFIESTISDTTTLKKDFTDIIESF